MKRGDYAALAARLLQGSIAERASTPPSRERGLSTIERALVARKRRHGRARGLALAAAALVCLGIGVRLVATRTPTTDRTSPQRTVVVTATPVGSGAALLGSNGEERLDGSVELTIGSRIATARGGGAHLSLSTGAHLELESETTLSLQTQTRLQRFSLVTGALSATVAKLGLNERFIVDTPDVQIEVRGTVFRLGVVPPARACARGGGRTWLEVLEGVVEVRAGAGTTLVSTGEHWPLECRSDELGVDATPAPATGSTPLPSVPDAPGHERPRRHRTSSLAQQNELFERALRARQEDDLQGALRAYDAFLDRYPTSALAENAIVGRVRLLAAIDPSKAAVEAARYLERYPTGFAREEAEQLVRQRRGP